jgi:hypothetical protein
METSGVALSHPEQVAEHIAGELVTRMARRREVPPGAGSREWRNDSARRSAMRRERSNLCTGTHAQTVQAKEHE